jgi:hypothetical protein
MPPMTNDDGSITYFAPGAYFGGALADYSPGSTVPFDTDGDGAVDTEADFRDWLQATGSIDPNQSEMQPVLRDDDGDGDDLDTYLGKPDADWSGSFGFSFTIANNVDLNTLFEFRTGNYYVENLTDAFRKANSVIGLNTPEAAAVEATLRNPDAAVDAKFDAAMEWATELAALSPRSGLNTIYNAQFIRMREISLAYRVPTTFAEKIGLSNLTVSVAGRNLFKIDGYDGIDQESNMEARSVGSGVGSNFNYGVDAFGTPIPRRFTMAVQFGF